MLLWSKRRAVVSLLVVLAFLLAACGASPAAQSPTTAPTAVTEAAPGTEATTPPTDASSKLKVVATFSILGDLVTNVAGDLIDLTVLVGPDSDPHVYQPVPQDSVTLAGADLIIENGLEFETWFDALYEASGSQAPRVELAERVTPLPAGEGHSAHDEEHAHDDGLAHACQHFGDDPVAVTAATTAAEATAVMPDDHTRYDLTLSNGAGFVVFEQDRDGDVLFFLGSDANLTLLAGTTPLAPENVAPITEGCDAVKIVYTFDLEPGSYFVQFGSQAPTPLALVWERGEEHSDSEAGHEDDHGHSHGEYDPHIWQDPNNAMLMVEVIRDALSEADPTNADTYQLNTERYLAELTALDAFVQAEVSRLPVEARKLVTTHDTFAYFADRYEFTVVGTALGTTTENADPSAGDLAALVNEIRAVGVPAIFADNVSNPTLMETIAREAGVTLVTDLHTDALSQPEGPAGTYVAMIQHNVTTIVNALAE